VSDVRLLEGNGGAAATLFQFTVTLSAPSGLAVQVDWGTVDGTDYSANLDGAVQGFLFPDRRNNDLYAATHGLTQDRVEAITDTGLLAPKWGIEPVLTAPSTVLHQPGTDDIYVGVRDDYPGAGDGAAVLKLDASSGAVVGSVSLESVAVPTSTLSPFSRVEPWLMIGLADSRDVGGLFATFITLVLAPAGYLIAEDVKATATRVWRRPPVSHAWVPVEARLRGS